jgi:hypothetical protein
MSEAVITDLSLGKMHNVCRPNEVVSIHNGDFQWSNYLKAGVHKPLAPGIRVATDFCTQLPKI